MLVYIHVPFCRSRCRYCAFHSLPLGPASPDSSPRVAAYRDSLLRELDLWAARLGRRPVESVFFGGGTPSLLPPDFQAAVLERIDRHFHLAAVAEISMEANPESLLARRAVDAYLAAGINRISMGVQSMDDSFLSLLGRPHRRADVLRAVEHLRAAGCRNLGLDLMWGLPGQDAAHWLATLEDALALEPEHVSAYGLTLEEGTPLERDWSAGRLSLPEDDEQERMYLEGIRLLAAHGLEQYEISNYARPGFFSRHNMGYWTGADYLGLGPAATSTLEGRRWTDTPDQARWQADIDAGRPDHDAEAITPRIRLEERLMLSLRTCAGFGLAEYTSLSGRDFMADHGGWCRELVAAGLARLDGDRLALTPQGLLVSNAVVADLFERLDELGIEYEVIPGVSSFLATAAVLKKEYTLPGVSQTVILTRMEGRTPMPPKEKLIDLAQHNATMIIFLSVGMLDEMSGILRQAYRPDTPVAVVYKATWEDQKIVIGDLTNIAEKVKAAGITKTALTVVGDFLGDEYELSKLYDKTFTTEFRKGVSE